MLLPRPYEDEIIGSALLRGCRQLGIQPKRLAPMLRGGSTAPPSPVLPSCIGMMAQAMGLPAYEILYEHTVFPYVTAFMEREQVALFEQKLLGAVPLGKSCFAALQSRAGIPYLRLCQRCIREELSKYGESYWHRSHLLPGVHVCLRHGVQLLETDLRCMGFFRTTLPNEANCNRYQASLRPGVLNQIALASNELLRLEHAWPGTRGLRQLALDKNFGMNSSDIPSVKIVEDVLKFYSKEFLSEVHCQYSSEQKSPWPALVLRQSSSNLAPIKYLLMAIYLGSRRRLQLVPTREAMGYKKPGPTPHYKDIESLAILAILKNLNTIVLAEQRVTVKALLLEAGIWCRYRHNRAAYPALAELLYHFRSSDQSERQIGKRLRWRKKS